MLGSARSDLPRPQSRHDGARIDRSASGCLGRHTRRRGRDCAALHCLRGQRDSARDAPASQDAEPSFFQVFADFFVALFAASSAAAFVACFSARDGLWLLLARSSFGSCFALGLSLACA